MHQPAPFPIAQLRLALVQQLQRVVEGVVVDLGGGQADLGDVRFVFFGDLGLFGEALLLDGDFFLFFGPLLFADGDVLLLARFRFGGDGGFLLPLGFFALLGFLLLGHDRDVALLDRFLFGDDGATALLIHEEQRRGDDRHDGRQRAPRPPASRGAAGAGGGRDRRGRR